MQGSLTLVPPDDFAAMLLMDLVTFSNSSPETHCFDQKKNYPQVECEMVARRLLPLTWGLKCEA